MSNCYTEMCGPLSDDEPVIGDCCVIERNGECIKGVYQSGGQNIVNGVPTTILSCVSKTTNGKENEDGNVSKQKDNTIKYIGIGAGALLFIALLIYVYFKYYRKQVIQ